MKGKMSAKQRRFVEEYLTDLNGAQAAVRAGYSLPTAAAQASRLLTKANVQEAVANAVARRAERTEITQDWVVEQLRETARLCLRQETFEPQAANRALELIGKHLGMFVEKRELTVTPGADRPLRSWSLEELEWMRDHLRTIEGEGHLVPDPEPEALPEPE